MTDAAMELRFRVAGLAAWAMVVVAGVLRHLATRPAGWVLALWAACLAGFVVLQVRRRPAAGRGVASLGVQVLAALGVLATSHTGFESALLAITAAQAPELRARVRPGLWVAAQVLASLGVFLALWPPVRALVTAVIHAGFQVFALGAAELAQREADARARLAAAHVELRAAQARLLEQERERERLHIARELHDSLGHHLTALSLNLEAAAHTVQGAGADHVGRAQAVVRRLLADVRGVVSALREPGVAALGPALRALAADVPGLQVHLVLPEAPLAVEPPAAAQALVRCAQEALTNALRHGRARNLWLDVAPGDGGVRLRARDDGAGPRGPLVPGHGLRGMAERVEALGGHVAVRPGGGGGVEVEAWVPCRPVAAPGGGP